MNLNEYQTIVGEISDLCKKHGVVLIGACNSESMYSEILIIDADDHGKSGWSELEKRMK